MWPEGPAPAVKVCGLTVAAEAAGLRRAGRLGDRGGVRRGQPAPGGRRDGRRGARRRAAPTVARVGVFVDATPAEMAAAARVIGLTHLQIHGDTDPAEAREASGLPVIQGVRVDGPEALERARASAADLVMLDAAVPGQDGGTGVAFDWSLLDDAALGRPFALAGGLRARERGRGGGPDAAGAGGRVERGGIGAGTQGPRARARPSSRPSRRRVA